MIPSKVTRALAVALPLTLGLARHRIGILAVLVVLPAAVARAQVGEAPPKPAFADNAPVIPHESLTKVALRTRRLIRSSSTPQSGPPRQSDRDPRQGVG